MSVSELTRPTLLIRLGDRDDADAWAEFVQVYSPLVFDYLRGCGLQEADAADVMQEVLRSVLRSIGRFVHDRSRGSFRGWLMKVTKSRLRDFVARQSRQVSGSGDTAVRRAIDHVAKDEVPEEERLEWERAYQRRVFQWAAEQVKGEFQDHTWQAFWMTRVENQDVKLVAEKLGMKVPTVYVARGRVMARIQQKASEIGDER